MSERDDLTASIANTIVTYRQGEISEPTSQHVDRWASQFDPQTALPFLREFDQAIKKTFFTKESTRRFLSGIIKNEKITGKDPASYWKGSNILNIQQKGQSQKEMVKIFANELKEAHGLDLNHCGSPEGDYIYLDDVLFTGGRISTDLIAWLKKAPQRATVHIILIAAYTGGEYYIRTKKLKIAIEATGKKIETHFWRCVALENTLYNKFTSDVLWPIAIPDDELVQAYVKDMDIKLRLPGGKSLIFSDEVGRQVLEREFVLAGVKIRSLTAEPKDFHRPIGCGNFGLGFGAILATYRNCPNNSPLAIWWGDPKATSGALHWYPLLPRKTYAAPENLFNGFGAL
ncbi:phosphoribosyltransferase-like protein [Pseudomonas frederiksbergensis]|uniref:phosphoribosyltransferase-like protein n=1 Tax=Pseudomonas frederiksbergensis TaxID=104087 RepID=UPI000F475302|nr:hypothetical protein [Pseudomonas frederiksbergensis]